MHVWPSAGLGKINARANDNSTFGFGPTIGLGNQKGFGIVDDFAFDDAKAGSIAFLTTSRQRELLEAMPLGQLLDLTGYKVVVHDESASMAMARQPTPLATNADSCHAELLIADLTYARVYMYGHNLKSFIVLREFGPGRSLQHRIGLSLQSPLVTPAKEKKRTVEAFTQDLEHAYVEAVKLFALARNNAQSKRDKVK